MVEKKKKWGGGKEIKKMKEEVDEKDERGRRTETMI